MREGNVNETRLKMGVGSETNRKVQTEIDKEKGIGEKWKQETRLKQGGGWERNGREQNKIGKGEKCKGESRLKQRGVMGKKWKGDQIQIVRGRRNKIKELVEIGREERMEQNQKGKSRLK